VRFSFLGERGAGRAGSGELAGAHGSAFSGLSDTGGGSGGSGSGGMGVGARESDGGHSPLSASEAERAAAATQQPVCQVSNSNPTFLPGHKI